ncbi:MAG: hypothetical protein IPK04_18540 [Bdellovibrionales bacterium]|nr:hypothetical protein [Bdellovibrionales bacterium]
MRSLIIILTSLWSCFGYSQNIKIPDLQTSFILPSKWSLKKNLLDFDFVLLSPFSKQDNTRSTIGILAIGKVNFAKFTNDPKYLDDFQNQKKEWVLKHGGTFNSSRFKKTTNKVQNIIESSFSISNVPYVELTFVYFCKSNSIQVKGMFPNFNDADSKIFDSLIEKTKCLMEED